MVNRKESDEPADDDEEPTRPTEWSWIAGARVEEAWTTSGIVCCHECPDHSSSQHGRNQFNQGQDEGSNTVSVTRDKTDPRYWRRCAAEQQFKGSNTDR